MSRIASVFAREILDSRGDPTVETRVRLESGVTGIASVPSGASTGANEAVERRDKDRSYYRGKGVLGAVASVNGEIAAMLLSAEPTAQRSIDTKLCELDGTPDKSRLGANAILSVSLACARAASLEARTPLYRYLGGIAGDMLPMPMFNVLNGGRHAGNGLDVQEFLVLPVGAKSFSTALRMASEIWHALGTELGAAGVGDEGGWAADLYRTEDALDALERAIRRAGYEPGRDAALAMDAASSEWYADGIYRLPRSGETFSRDGLVRYWEKLCGEHPIVSLEDGMAEEDWQGWRQLTDALGGRIGLIGDDLFVTDMARIRKGAAMGTGNAVLIKPNQRGTLSETADAVREAREHGFRVVFSHRSGETEDTFLADLAVALGGDGLKAGAPARGERCAKYNRLLAIELELGKPSRMRAWENTPTNG